MGNYGFEADILMWIQENIRCDWLTPFMEFVSLICEVGIVWIVMGLCLLISRKTRKCGALVLIALLLSVIINNMMLKNLVARVRPYNVIDGLVPLGVIPKDFSFPSGHSGASFSAAFVILRNQPSHLRIPAFIAAILIALSRLYLGMHYPSDVMAGVIIGYIDAVLAEKVLQLLFILKVRFKKE